MSIMRRTAGCRPSTFLAKAACIRSIASVYCVRSFVPMEKKSSLFRELRRHQHGGRNFDHDADLDRRHAQFLTHLLGHFLGGKQILREC